MYIHWESSIHPTVICFLFLLCFVFFKGRGVRVIVVYKCIFIEKLLCTQLLFGFSFYYFVGRNKEVGGLDIKYFFGNKSIFLEKVLYTQLVFLFLLLFCWGIWGLDIKYFLYINVYFLRNLYTPNYYLFVFYYYFIGGVRGVGGLDI
jgi:hypothetical protein